MTLADRIRAQVSADDTDKMLSWYLDRKTFSGAWFETLGGPGDDPAVADRFTSADIVAVSTLSVRIPGWAAITLLEARAGEFNRLLEAVPSNRANPRPTRPSRPGRQGPRPVHRTPSGRPCQPQRTRRTAR